MTRIGLDGVEKPYPLPTHWYGPAGFGFSDEDSNGRLIAIFYQPEKPDPGKKAFPAPAGTFNYIIKTDFTSIGVNEKGDLAPEYPTIKKEMDRLIADASRFDLTNNRDLTEYGKYVGEQLKLAKGKAISFDIRAESGKELFFGKLQIGKSGESEMAPSAKGDMQGVERKPGGADPKPASSLQFDTPLGYYAGVGQITGRKVKSRALAGLTIVGEKTEAKYEYGETKAGPNEALVWVRFHTPEAVKNDVHFDKYSAVIDKKSYSVLASTTDLNAEFAEAIRKATTQHGADKSTYLLFAIPDSATKFRLVYADTGIDLAVPVPTVPEEVAPENATPNPTPGRDGVGVSIFDRTTGKVGDIPPAATQKLLEFSLTLDLSRAADREKLIQKWHELAGDKADRQTVTIWAAGKQYRWPPAVPTLGQEDEKTKARKQVFADGLDYFIWSTEKERVKSREGLLRMLIGFEYELNPEKTEGPFSIVMSFAVKDSASGKNYEHQGVFTPEKLENHKSGRTGAVLFGAESLKGEGDAVEWH